MYVNEEQEQRVYNLASIAGVDSEIVRIFTSRIPKEIIKISATGKKRTHDGDKKILPILDRLYDMKGLFSDDSLENKNLTLLYRIKHPNPDNKTMSFKRFVLLEFLISTFPKEKTTISNRKVSFPSEVPILKLEKSEVDVLYDWLVTSNNQSS